MKPSNVPYQVLIFLGLLFFGTPLSLESTEFADHRRWIEYTALELVNRGLDVSTLPIIEEGSFYSFSSNLVVHLPGTKTDRILLVVPLPGPETIPENEVVENFLRASLLLIEEIQRAERPFDIDILFAGAEFEQQKSLRSYLTSPDTPEYQLAVYLQGWGSPGLWEIVNGSNGEVSPGWLLRSLMEGMSTYGLQPSIQGLMTQLYSLGLGPTTPLEPLFQRAIPSILLGTSSDSSRFVPENHIASLAQFLTQDRVVRNPEQDWERHYILLQFNSLTWYIGEQTYITLTFVLLGGVLLRIWFNSRGRKNLSRVIFKFWLLVFGLSLAMFLLMVVGSLLPELIMVLRDFPSLPHYNPGAFFLLKVLSGTALLGWVFGAFLLVIPRDHGHVYSAIAIGTLVLDVLILSTIQVTLGYYYLWALVCTLFFIEARSLWGKAFWFLLSPFWLLKSLVELFSLSPSPILQAFIGVNLPVDLLISLLLVPYVAMFLRLRILATENYTKNSLFVSSLGFGATAIGVFWVLYFFNPFTNEPQPYQVVLQDSLATIESPAPFSQFGSYEFPTSTRIQTLPYLPPESSLAWESTDSVFLNRVVYELVLQFPPYTNRVQVLVQAEGSEVLYDSNFPFRSLPEEGTLEILLGDYPPRTVDIQLIVPEGSQPRVKLQLTRELPHHPLAEGVPGDRVRVIEIVDREFSP